MILVSSFIIKFNKSPLTLLSIKVYLSTQKRGALLIVAIRSQIICNLCKYVYDI